jgi:hypothetical protein
VIPLYSAGKPFSVLVFSGVRAPPWSRLTVPQGKKTDTPPCTRREETIVPEGKYCTLREGGVA